MIDAKGGNLSVLRSALLRASVRSWYRRWRDGMTLFGYVFRQHAMRPHQQKHCNRESCAGGSKNERLQPTESRRGNFVEPGTNARNKRGRNIGVGCDLKTRIDGCEKRLLCVEELAAGRALLEMRAQLPLRSAARSGCFN